MTTLNAKANAAYHALIDEYEREHPDGVWLGFDHQRDAYEQGWEDGHEARAMPTQEQIAKALHDLDNPHSWRSGSCVDHSCEPLYHVRADAILALINGTES